jgi:putative transposase
LKKDVRPQFYVKDSDASVLEEIKAMLKLRSTYGYKRITAMVNRLRLQMGKPRYNKKRVLRIMRKNGLVFPKTVTSRTHRPTGKVMTLNSNMRWCSDCFEIKCINGEKVFVIFVLDTCDREIIGFITKREPILAGDVQSIMIESVEKRFGKTQAPRNIQFLSDRGSIYRATQTIEIASQLNLKSCFTMAYSPESNGMAEAFVKTIKRDYVYANDCADPDAVLDMMPNWFRDYNEEAPHSALGMLSPVEYLRKTI